MRIHYLDTVVRREAAEEANLAGTPIPYTCRNQVRLVSMNLET